MFWIILLLVGIILLIYSSKKYADGLVCLSIIIVVINFIMTPVIIIEGISTYPDLIKQFQKVKTLRQRINDIKNAVYPEQSGKLIAGSLTNLQQSSKLSDYLRQIAEAEASYNSLLVKAQFYKRDYMWLLFGHGFFISNKVFQLSKIEK